MARRPAALPRRRYPPGGVTVGTQCEAVVALADGHGAHVVLCGSDKAPAPGSTPGRTPGTSAVRRPK